MTRVTEEGKGAALWGLLTPKYNIGSSFRPMGALQSSHSSYADGRGLLGYIDKARLAGQDNGSGWY